MNDLENKSQVGGHQGRGVVGSLSRFFCLTRLRPIVRYPSQLNFQGFNQSRRQVAVLASYEPQSTESHRPRRQRPISPYRLTAQAKESLSRYFRRTQATRELKQSKGSFRSRRWANIPNLCCTAMPERLRSAKGPELSVRLNPCHVPPS